MYQGFDLTPWQKRGLLAVCVFIWLIVIEFIGWFAQPRWLRYVWHVAAYLNFFWFYNEIKARVRHLVVRRMMHRKLETFFAPQPKEAE